MADFIKTRNIRYWSDYSHVYYLPRSVQRVPSSPHWEASREDWKQSQDQFQRYNEVRMPRGRFRQDISELPHDLGQ